MCVSVCTGFVCVCVCGSEPICGHTDVCVAEPQNEAPAGFMSAVVWVFYRG